MITSDSAVNIIAYGDHERQRALLVRAADHPRPRALLAVVHGGFWRAEKDPASLLPACHQFAKPGVATASIGYRTVESSAEWADSVHDVVHAVQALHSDTEVPLPNIILVGHSAGGHLALLAAHQLPNLGAVVGLAPISDMRDAASKDLGEGAVNSFVRTPLNEVLSEVSPRHMPPPPCPVTLIHGAADQAVPVDQSRDYADYLRAEGATVRLRIVEQARHMHLVKPERPAWQIVQDEVLRNVKDMGHDRRN